MNFLFAWRYFKSKKNTNAINIIAWISIVAIAVGTAALVIVLSVFNGFESLVKGMYGDFYADAKIVSAKGNTLKFSKENVATLKQIQLIKAISFCVEEKALLKNGENQATIVVKGVDANFNAVSNVGKHLIRGEFDLGTQEKPLIVLGAGVESATGIYVEKATEASVLYLPNKKATTITNIDDALLSYNVLGSGTFFIQQEFDNKYVFTNLAFMRFMLDMQADECSFIELKLNAKTDSEVENICAEIEQKLGTNVKVLSRYQQNKSLYRVMTMEKWIIYAILCLILVVAAFNMIGALTMLVLEKQKDIAILKAVGASENKIQQIFLSTGLLLAGIGGLIGISLASLICWLQVHFKLLKLGGSFAVDYYPVEQRSFDLLLVITTIFIVAFAASYFPARKAGKQLAELKS